MRIEVYLFFDGRCKCCRWRRSSRQNLVWSRTSSASGGWC